MTARWRRAPTAARARIEPLVRPRLRSIGHTVADGLDRVGLHRAGDPPVPPGALRRLNGARDFLTMGRAIADDIVAVTGLGPDERVLEVGCGAGRVAVALLERLGPEGSYEGFDVVPPAIRWCRRRISARHPGFGFTLVDVASSHYRPGAAGSAAELVFPYPDAEFDVAFATSLFTHLAPDATANYLGECARVLRPGGRLFATFFLVDEWTRDALAAGRGTRTLHLSIAGSWIEDPRDPHAAVAHDQDRLGEVLAAAGLVAEGPLRGNWCGREAVRHQDVVVARRT